MSKFEGPSSKNLGGVAKQSYGPQRSLISLFIYYNLPSDEGYSSETSYDFGHF